MPARLLLGLSSEGVRVKQWVKGNSIKMYDCHRVVRIETTFNNQEEFKVYRRRDRDPEGEKVWRILSKPIGHFAALPCKAPQAGTFD